MSLLISISFGAEVVLAARTVLDAVRLQLANRLPVLVKLQVEEDLEVGVEHHRGLAVRLFGLPLPMLLAGVGHLRHRVLHNQEGELIMHFLKMGQPQTLSHLFSYHLFAQISSPAGFEL